MKKMNLDESNGALLIDGNEIDLSSYSAFTNSSFFKCADDLTPFGKYYFFQKMSFGIMNHFLWSSDHPFFQLRVVFFLPAKLVNFLRI